ncbi:MAG: hypothetical protein HON90_14580 [Halobacteriovoraceae bacterium]|jgi:hypothetical protein|nr:hypothetical protein [Halobacteriovoraceae bacterium]
MKSFLGIFYILLSTQVLAATTQNITSVTDQVKSSPVALELELDNQLSRDGDNKIDGYANALALNFNYELLKTHSISLNTEISHQKIDSESSKSSVEFFEAGYSKEFQIDSFNTSLISSLYYKFPVNKNTREEENQNSSVYLFIESESKLSSRLTVEGEVQFLQFLNTSLNEEVVSNLFYIQANPVFSITDSFSLKLPLNLEFEFHNGKLGYGYSSTTIAPTVAYTFQSEIEVELYAKFTPYNGTKVISDFEKNATYGATLIYSVF